MAIPQEWRDILTGRNTNLRLQVVTDENGRQMVTAMNSDGEAKGDMIPLDQFVGQGMPNPYGGASPASTISYDEMTGQFGDAQDPAVTAYLQQNFPGMGLVHQNLGTDRFLDPSKVYDTPYGRVTSQSNVKAGESSFLESMINPASLFALAMGIPTLPGGGSGFSSLTNLLTGADAGVGALGDAVTGIDSLADFNGLSPGDYTDLGGIMGSGGEIGAAIGNGIAPVSDGMQLFDPLAEANGLQVGEYADLGGTLQPGAGGAVGDLLSGVNSLSDANGLTPTTYSGAGGTMTGAGGALTSALNRALGLNLTDTDTALLGKLAGAGIGLLGAGQTGSAMSSLADKYLNLGAPARARLEQSYADPGSYLAGPDMQAFLGEASKQQANALSSRFGNPAMSPNANKELLGSVANMASQGIYNYRNQLAAQGGLGVAPAAQFDASAATASTATPWNIAGAVVGDVTNPQKSIIDQMREMARLGGSSWMMAG